MCFQSPRFKEAFEKNAILIGLLLMVLSAGNAAHFYRLRISMPRTIDDRIVFWTSMNRVLKKRGDGADVIGSAKNQVGIRRG